MKTIVTLAVIAILIQVGILGFIGWVIVDGWLKFPEGDCYTTEETEVLALLEVVRITNGERARV